MKGIDKFQNAISKTAQIIWLPVVEGRKEEFGEIFKNYILELEGPKHLVSKISDGELYFRKIFDGFIEITASLQTLEDIAFYISRFPFSDEKITPERYLQFHVEAYYSEIYILSERLKKYLKLLERRHRDKPAFQFIKNTSDDLSSLLETSLKPVITLRGKHVHETRFKDDNISLSGSLGMLSKKIYDGEDELAKLFKAYYKEKYRDVKRNWKNAAKNNNKNIRELLDHFFEKLYPIVFNQDTGAFLYLGRIKK